MSCGGCGCCRNCGCQATCTCNRSIWSLESHYVNFSDVTSNTGLAVAEEKSASAWPSSSPFGADENGACCFISSNWHAPECGNIQAGESTVG